MRLDVKPLSVNDAWKGRRFKTDMYKAYEQEVILKLRKMDVPKGPLEIHLVFGFSSESSDWDNPIKPFQDCLQKKYGFNDNRIKRGIVDVVDVKKGQEFIEFDIKKLERANV